MKNNTLAILLMMSWMTPIMGLNLLNNSTKERTVVVSSDDQKTQFGIKSVLPGYTRFISMPSEPPRSEIHALAYTMVPARQEMTTIGSYAALKTQWIQTGKDAQNRPLLTRMVPSSKKEIIPKNAKSIYTVINDNITRIDSIPAEINKADRYETILTKASYVDSIHPNSYIIITQTPHVKMNLYDPKIVQYTAAKNALIGR